MTISSRLLSISQPLFLLLRACVLRFTIGEVALLAAIAECTRARVSFWEFVRFTRWRALIVCRLKSLRTSVAIQTIALESR
jgi:hypothetical protein